MQFLRANTQVKVVIGPVVAVGDGFTPVTSLSLSTADEAELMKHDAAAVVDISGATFAAITSADGYYNLTLTTSHTDTEGLMTVLINDDSLILPIKATFMVLSEAAYDSMFVAKDDGFMDVNIKTIGRADTQETEATNLEAACANYSATRGLTGTAVPAAAAGAAGGIPTDSSGKTAFNDPTATAIVDEWESQSQADPTGFHVNVLEWKGASPASLADTDKVPASTQHMANDVITGAAAASDFGAEIAALVETYIVNEGDATAVMQAIANLIAADWVAGDASPLAIVAALKADAQWSNLATMAAELAKVPKSDGSVTWNATALASINAEVDTGLTDYGGVQYLLKTTIATLTNQTSFTLTAGSADNTAYRGNTIVIQDSATAAQKAVGIVDAYTGSTKTVTLLNDPGVFTMAAGDTVYILAEKSLKPTTEADYHVDVTENGNVGPDWGNVDRKTTSNVLAGTSIAAADAITNEKLQIFSGTLGATGNDTTHLHLAGLSAYADDALNDLLIRVFDVSGSLYYSAWIDDWVSSTALATVATLPFTPQASTDTYRIFAIRRGLTAAQVNAEMVDVLATDTYAEPGQGAPAATTNLAAKIGYLYKAWRNKKTQDATELVVFADDATTEDHKATVSDDGSTLTVGEMGTGA